MMLHPLANARQAFLVLALAIGGMAQAPNVVQAQTKDQVVAVINDRNITLAEVDNTVFADIFALEQQIHALRKAALENLISRAVLEAEAVRKGVSVAELRQQLTEGRVEIRPEQVDEAYSENANVFGTMSPDEAKARLRLDLESQARMQRYRDALSKLREGSRISLFLEEPRLPPVNALNAPSTGPEKARVTIAEFADFQCPFCRSSEPTIRELLKTYGNEIRFIFKHLPLESHSEAFAAAQAAFCAGQQGSFWQYHDALFGSEDLSPDVLNKLAESLHLDLPRFSTCLTSNDSRLAVQKDLDEARRVGINSTPTFVINGKLVRGALELEQFRAAIEFELKRAGNNH